MGNSVVIDVPDSLHRIVVVHQNLDWVDTSHKKLVVNNHNIIWQYLSMIVLLQSTLNKHIVFYVFPHYHYHHHHYYCFVVVVGVVGVGVDVVVNADDVVVAGIGVVVGVVVDDVCC